MTKEELKEGSKPKDEELETYSKGVQSRIAKLTRKMREAERQRDSATEYARAVETQRKADQRKYFKIDSDYQKRFEDIVLDRISSVVIREKSQYRLFTPSTGALSATFFSSS